MRALDRLFRRRAIASAVKRLFSPASLFTNGEQGAWYDPSDLTTLYQDSAGTTPVTAVEQYVALVLDKRNTSYSVYFDGSGDKLTTASNPGLAFASGDFTVEAWVYPTTLSSYHTVIATRPNSVDSQTSWSVTVTGSGTPPGNGAVVFYSNGFTPSTASGNVVINQWTHVAVTRNGSTLRIFCNGVVLYTGADTKNYTDQVVTIGALASTTETLTGYVSNARIVKGAALYTANFTPPSSPLTAVAGTSLLTCGNAWSGNPSITQSGDVRADKLSPFATGTGNHAFQATSTKRPVLSARVNLLTKTEDFSDAVWGVETGASKTGSNVALSPIGTLTADSITLSSTAYSGVQQTITSSVATYVFSAYVKVPSGTKTFKMLRYSSTNGFQSSATFTATTEWQRFEFIVSATTAVASSFWPLANIGTDAGEFHIWGADLRVANDGVNLPAYQRVNTATDYDTVGFPKYLKFDGIDDALQTNSINFTSTDKMTVWAGVRKLITDPTLGIIAEIGTDVFGGNGSFALGTRNNGTELGYGSLLRGTSAAGYWPSTYIAPHTAVLSTQFDIGLSGVANEVKPRVNAATPTSLPVWNSTDAGSGSFGNLPLYIGMRAGTSSPFNGRLYSLIVRGAQSTADQISKTEDYVEAKTFGKDMAYVYSDPVTTALGEQITTADGQDVFMMVAYQ